MRRKIDNEIKAGIFLLAGIVLVIGTILAMGGAKTLFEKNYHLLVIVPDAGGLAKGAVVRSGGLKIGRVQNIEFSENYDNVKLTMRINQEYQQRIREDSVVRMQTQGVLGDKFLEISGGSSDKPAAKEGQIIQAEAGKDLSAMFAEGSSAVQLLKENLANLKVITGAMARKNQMDGIMKDLSEATANFKDFSKQMKSGSTIQDLNQTLKNVKIVTEKMKNGEGTIGALFSDSSLYEDLKHLIGGANRNNVLKFFVRQAVKSSDQAEVEKEEKTKLEAKKGKEPASKK